ncbi:hypothetical protein CMUS01_15875 [Colletotrichum musicola]|uniref:Uncharacterized protein n=1 Tax=Colletotrichum musicola TaxID=2175873 RepID=A0A8H6ITH0_9PEZI|nr:hypothetical protein CMUS01_15875 [Colletotrichum musicola]
MNLQVAERAVPRSKAAFKPALALAKHSAIELLPLITPLNVICTKRRLKQVGRASQLTTTTCHFAGIRLCPTISSGRRQALAVLLSLTSFFARRAPLLPPGSQPLRSATPRRPEEAPPLHLHLHLHRRLLQTPMD